MIILAALVKTSIVLENLSPANDVARALENLGIIFYNNFDLISRIINVSKEKIC